MGISINYYGVAILFGAIGLGVGGTVVYIAVSHWRWRPRMLKEEVVAGAARAARKGK